jgi:type IV secretory pathway TrbD component
MILNPFIELARDPVSTLSWLAYGLAMIAVGFGALRTVARGIPTLWLQYQNNKHTSGPNGWWAFGDRSAGYIPPLGWSIRLFAYLLVLAVAAWAAGALIWLVR